VARRVPDVSFVFLGQTHFEHAWTPTDLPPNVALLGHRDGIEKLQTLSRAWMLLNTSVHESLPVSFLEALAHEATIVSCQNPDGLAASYGRYVGHWDGDGLASVDTFVTAIRELVATPDATRALGRAGRAWVEQTHSREAFLGAFARLRRELRVASS
jgi:glycosyltransferase involved in cell wall biosynthesis